jgi:hypothetical protein
MIDDKITYDKILSTWGIFCEGALISKEIDFLHLESEVYRSTNFTWIKHIDIQDGKYRNANLDRGPENTCRFLWEYCGEKENFELMSSILILACIQDLEAQSPKGKSEDWFGVPFKLCRSIKGIIKDEKEELRGVSWHHNSHAFPYHFDTYLFKPEEYWSLLLKIFYYHVVFNFACWRPTLVHPKR